MQELQVKSSTVVAQRIGALIQGLRKESHMTGGELAAKVGVSQSRISKIENGYPGSIDAGQLEVILDILKTPRTIRQQISMLLFQYPNKSGANFDYHFTDFPDELNDLQHVTSVFRCYVVNGLSALLQTSDYRIARLRKVGLSEEEAHVELGKTIERQEALWDINKTFFIIMPEAELYTMPADRRVQLAQLDRLERLIGSGNLQLGIIPLQVGTSLFETGTFTIYDDEILYIFIGDRTIRVQDPETLLNFINAFNEMSGAASFNAEALALIRKASNYFAGSILEE